MNMEKKYIYLGPLYQKEREKAIISESKTNISNAPNTYQWSLLSGLEQLLGDNLRIINVLPVGTWWKHYRKLYLKGRNWQYKSVKCHEIGSINFPVLKQLIRASKVKRILKNAANDNTELIIYSAYMPFLRAVYKLPPEVKVTAIITDLPEFYDLGKTSTMRKFLRKCQNRLVYKYLSRVDRFVVLTDQMCEPLGIGNRPWIRIEGIYDPQFTQKAVVRDKKGILYSGTLHSRYGIINLLRAFDEIQDPNLELWICGSGDAEKEVIKAAENDDRIKFFGFCEQKVISELRSKASILINPRTNDGEYTKYSFPSKTMEYLASGIPVIGYKLDGIPSEYDNYINYVSENTITALKESILIISEEESATYKTKATRAQLFLSEQKSPIIQADKLLRMIEKKNL